MKKYYGIEVLRFFTSISVLFYHYRHFFAPYNSTSNLNYFEISNSLPLYNFLGVIYDKGIFGVHVFYTISGFVFAHIYLNNYQKVSSKEFFINRFARLYPLHFATLILITILQFLSYYKYNSFQIIQLNDLYHFILNILFVSSWGFENGHSFNAPIWSVSVEVAIYILFFFLLFFLKKYKIFFVIFLSLVLLAIDKFKILDNLFLECARLFFSGTIIYYFYNMKFNNNIYLALSSLLLILSFIGNFKTFVFCPALVLFFSSLDNYINKKSLQSLFRKLGKFNIFFIPFTLTFPNFYLNTF